MKNNTHFRQKQSHIHFVFKLVLFSLRMATVEFNTSKDMLE